MKQHKQILASFAAQGLLDEKKIEEILSIDEDISLDQLLIRRGFLTEKQVLEGLSRVLGYPFMESIAQFQVPEEYCQLVPVHFSRTNNLVAISKENGTYIVATCSPLSIHPMDQLAHLLDGDVEPVLVPRSEIVSFITRSYQESGGLEGAIEDMNEKDMEEITRDMDETEDLLEADTNKPYIIRSVNNILLQALKQRASDIHMQPYEDKLQIRYRIDGILYDKDVIPKKYQEAIVSRVKVMGRMDIAEKRLPQDGRRSIRVGDAEVDIRINSVPTSYGERVVMRLLDKSARLYALEEIGLDQEGADIINKYIHYTHGIILLTGPTGSGKTTTLYAALAKINSSEKNIITIEDPIEYNLRGISQIQVSSKKGMTFGEGLRALLRQDPNIMMIGEIRDIETARIAIQASITGHLVFSTLHTNDSASAVTRLIDIGIEPYLVSSTMLCVIAQRLARRICSGCKEPYKPLLSQLQSIGLSPKDLGPEKVLWKGKGCERCMGTGYHDRTGLYEILPIDEAIRQLVVQKVGATVIKQKGIENGLKSLRMRGVQKMLEGETTIDEVLRVTQVDVAG